MPRTLKALRLVLGLLLFVAATAVAEAPTAEPVVTSEAESEEAAAAPTVSVGTEAVASEKDRPAFTQWALGLAVEARAQKEVSPEAYGTQAVAGLFAQARRAPWSALLELNQRGLRTRSGIYAVTSRTRTLGLWARYEPWDQGSWLPFVALGTGALFDQVQTTLGASDRVDEGRRLFVGGGVGLTRSFFERCVIEFEARAASEEQVPEPALSGWMRLGFYL